MKCPKCGSKESARILYGMPAFSEELEKKLNNKELFLGGCCISSVDPKYHCNSCNRNFAASPLLLSKQGSEDYRLIVTSIRFSDGSSLKGFPEILIR